MVPFWTMVETVFFSAFLLVTSLTFTFIRPTNVEQSLLHPASFQNQFSCNVSMFFSPIFLRLLAQQCQPDTILQFFIFMRCCPLLPIRLFWPCCNSIFFTSLGQTYLISIFISSLKTSVCQYGQKIPKSWVSHITAPASPLTWFHV